MYFQINDDAYTIAEGGVQKPILQITNPEALEPLQEIANSIGELERRFYTEFYNEFRRRNPHSNEFTKPKKFINGAEDFLSDLCGHKDHFVSIVSRGDKKIGYLFAWREKISLGDIENLLDDDLPLSQDEISEPKEKVSPDLGKDDGCITSIYISDVAVASKFARCHGEKNPPSQELLGWLAAWAIPAPGKTVFVHAETRKSSTNLDSVFQNLFHNLSVTTLLDKEYFDSRGETMHTKIWRVTASEQQQSIGGQS